MRAEVITVGDEVLAGHTVDTNSAHISRQLASIGIEVGYKVTVADDVERIAAAIVSAWQRSRVVIATGGLGPTEDDLTKKAICQAFERKLVFHDEIVEQLKQRYAARGVRMPALNQNQGLQPQGSTFIANPLGTAPGIVIEDGERYFAALPGVPSEMKAMISTGVLPALRKMAGEHVIEIQRIRTVGISEARIAEEIADLVPASENIKLAFLPGYSGVDLRITGKGMDRPQIQRSIEQLSRSICERLQKHIYEVGEQSLAQVVGSLLQIKGKTLATAESCTGGLIAKTITDVPGSSEYFIGSVVAYDNSIKQNVLNVSPQILDSMGAVSEQVVLAMAAGARRLTGADYAISSSGIAGPGGATLEKPVGLVWLGYDGPGGQVSLERKFPGDRQAIRERATMMTLELLRRRLLEDY